MILPSDIIEIGVFNKTHGINGEISATVHYDGLEPDELRCVIVDVDGIFVPFFIESCRPKGRESWLIRLSDVTDERQATPFVNQTIFALRDDPEMQRVLEDEGEEGDGFYAEDFEGFRVSAIQPDGTSAPLGTIVDLDTSTPNALFIISLDSDPDRTVLVPVAEEFFVDIDIENRNLTLSLPDGLLD